MYGCGHSVREGDMTRIPICIRPVDSNFELIWFCCCCYSVCHVFVLKCMHAHFTHFSVIISQTEYSYITVTSVNPGKKPTVAINQGNELNCFGIFLIKQIGTNRDGSVSYIEFLEKYHQRGGTPEGLRLLGTLHKYVFLFVSGTYFDITLLALLSTSQFTL